MDGKIHFKRNNPGHRPESMCGSLLSTVGRFTTNHEEVTCLMCQRSLGYNPLQIEVTALKKKLKAKETIIAAAGVVAHRKVFRTADKTDLRNLLDCCIECSCIESDCIQCIEDQDEPCHWVAPRKCSRCFDDDGRYK